MRLRPAIHWMLSCLLVGGACLAAEPFVPKEEPAAKVSLILPERAPADKEALGVLEFDIPEGWHVYWKNPGEIGLAPTFSWKLPEGVSVPKVDWPSPRRYDEGAQAFYGYAGKARWVVHFDIAETVQGELPIEASVFWLGCNNVCVPFAQDVQGKLVVEGGEETVVPPAVKEALQKMPQAIGGATASLKGDVLKVTMPGAFMAKELKEVIFFPELQGIFSPGVPTQWMQKQDGIEVTISCYEGAKEILAAKDEISGLVQLVFPQETVATYAISAPVSIVMPEVAPPPPLWTEVAAPTKIAMDQGMWAILAFAFLGGMLLNATPCVLPVIGLKVLHLLSFGEERRARPWHGIAFTLGVLSMFGLLAGGLYLLQHLGISVGWGFQLQNPMFITSLMLVMFVFALGLFDVVEMGSSLSAWSSGVEGQLRAAAGPSLVASYVSGLFVTLVATPCTGPFLGSALGFAMAFSPADGALIFGAIGLGMAMPFLLATFFPGLMKILPRPGPWMVTLKQFFGFCALATVVWLAWVLHAETKELSLPLLFLSLFVMAVAIWILGRFGNLSRSRVCRLIARLFALFFVVTSFALAFISFESPVKSIADKYLGLQEQIQWEPFTRQKLEQEVVAGKIVFVKFSAKWCLLCQANSFVFLSDDVVHSFAKYGVTALDADWTNGDPQITEMLKSLGRSGVPTNAVFMKGKQPIVLPEIATPDSIVDAIKEMVGEKENV